MMDELCVQDIMERPRSLYCSPDSNLETIINRLNKMEDMGNEIDFIIVKDDVALVGILLPVDIFNALNPTCFHKNYIICEFAWKGLFTQRCKRLVAKQAGQFMKKPEGLKPGDNLMKAANFLVKKQVELAPVIHDNELVGLVRSKSLFRLMTVSVA